MSALDDVIRCYGSEVLCTKKVVEADRTLAAAELASMRRLIEAVMEWEKGHILNKYYLDSCECFNCVFIRAIDAYKKECEE